MKTDYIKPGALDPKSTGGVVGQPHVGTDYAFGGITKSADTSGAHGVAETTASGENLSAKFKNPNVKQDVPEKGKNQFEFHG